MASTKLSEIRMRVLRFNILFRYSSNISSFLCVFVCAFVCCDSGAAITATLALAYFFSFVFPSYGVGR